MAADLPSVIPTVPRWARFRAARAQFELTTAGQAAQQGRHQGQPTNAFSLTNPSGTVSPSGGESRGEGVSGSSARLDGTTMGSGTDAPAARQACLDNARVAATAVDTSAAECRAYLEMVSALQDPDLARALLARWERLAPGDPQILRIRIPMEISAGAAGSASRLIDQLLLQNPVDPWALEQKEAARAKLRELLDAAPTSVKPNP
jgi:hypothetical protein